MIANIVQMAGGSGELPGTQLQPAPLLRLAPTNEVEGDRLDFIDLFPPLAPLETTQPVLAQQEVEAPADLAAGRIEQQIAETCDIGNRLPVVGRILPGMDDDGPARPDQPAKPVPLRIAHSPAPHLHVSPAPVDTGRQALPDAPELPDLPALKPMPAPTKEPIAKTRQNATIAPAPVAAAAPETMPALDRPEAPAIKPMLPSSEKGAPEIRSQLLPQPASEATTAGSHPLAALPAEPVAQPAAKMPGVGLDMLVRDAGQIETLIENLSLARETGRQARGEMQLRHEDFGLLTVRLASADGELKASLTSRDPAFAVAAQHALGERVVQQASDSGAAQSRLHDNSGGQAGHSGQSLHHDHRGAASQASVREGPWQDTQEEGRAHPDAEALGHDAGPALVMPTSGLFA